jgi:DNA recombination protein RmuC
MHLLEISMLTLGIISFMTCGLILFRIRSFDRVILNRIASSEERLERTIRSDSSTLRLEILQYLFQNREEFLQQLNLLGNRFNEESQNNRHELRSHFESFRLTFEPLISQMLRENQRNLDEIRKTVSEKLEGTLERRLGTSFKLVSDRLEQVFKGLGEMQTLANGVGDLKKVMSNIKTRGIWGEVQLGALLDQLLIPEQFERNAQVKKESSCRVEYALKLPGAQTESLPWIWLPIDAKFPIETYQRLVDAQERSDQSGCDSESKLLETFIKSSARDIYEKYISPPETTDFAIMYLPTEGLFAEVVRKPGLIEHLQREYRVIIAGPTTLAALLNSLQMGFRTLAIQKRSSEVWQILGAVKSEFIQFEDILKKVEKKLQEAGNVIETAGRRSRAIQRSLKSVEASPSEISEKIIPQLDTI